MRFKDIVIHNSDLDYPSDGNSFYGYSGNFTVDATEELITTANQIRKRAGFTDFPSEDNDIYYNFYLAFSCEKEEIVLNFSVAYSEHDDYRDYEIDLFPEEKTMLLFKIIDYLAMYHINEF